MGGDLSLNELEEEQACAGGKKEHCKEANGSLLQELFQQCSPFWSFFRYDRADPKSSGNVYKTKDKSVQG